jgi:hypothetical protein
MKLLWQSRIKSSDRSPKTVWKGEKQAPVSIVLYGDYESEACAKANHVA